MISLSGTCVFNMINLPAICVCDVISLPGACVFGVISLLVPVFGVANPPDTPHVLNLPGGARLMMSIVGCRPSSSTDRHGTRSTGH